MRPCSNCQKLTDSQSDKCIHCRYVCSAVEPHEQGSARGRTRYIRCNRVVGVVLADIMREYLLLSNIPPRSIYDSIMKNWYLKKTLSRQQMNAIQSLLTQGFSNFDISLMYKIVRQRNFWMIVPDIPTRNWGTEPIETEDTIGDNIERIRITRNKLDHNGQHFLTEKEFQDMFHLMEDIAKRADRHLGKPDEHFQNRVASNKTSQIDKESEENFLRKFKEIRMQTQTGFIKVYVEMDAIYDKIKRHSETGKVELKLTLTNIENSAEKAKYVSEHTAEIDTEDMKITKATEGSLVVHVIRTKTYFVSEDSILKEVERFVSSLFRTAHLKRVQTDQCSVFVETDDELFEEDDYDLQDEENEEPNNLIIQVEVEKVSLQSDERMSQSLNIFMNSLLKHANGQPFTSSNEIHAFVEVVDDGRAIDGQNERSNENLKNPKSIDDCQAQTRNEIHNSIKAEDDATFEAERKEVTDFLCGLGLQRLDNTFKTEQISMDTLIQMDDEDLLQINIRKGPRFKILKATAELKKAHDQILQKSDQMNEFLVTNGLQDIRQKLESEDITLDDLVDMKESDFEEVGIEKEMRDKLLKSLMQLQISKEDRLSQSSMQQNKLDTDEASKIKDKHAEEKECDPDVYNILKSIKLEELAPVFSKEAITMNVLEEMDQAALEKIGIRKYGHRSNIVLKLKDHKEKENSDTGYETIPDDFSNDGIQTQSRNLQRSISQPAIPKSLPLTEDHKSVHGKDKTRKKISVDNQYVRLSVQQSNESQLKKNTSTSLYPKSSNHPDKRNA